MYERFYNLTADPFRLSPDHRFCYQHPHYTKAKAYMAYAYRRAEGFVMVTGNPGTGKTTLIGDLIEYLTGEKAVVANLVSTQLAADDLLRMVGFMFGVKTPNTEKSTILQELGTKLLALREDGQRALLIVDEAQDLSTRAMEELRLLTNLQEDGQPLLQIFLLGQPELREMVREKDLEPLYQRIIAASHLKALEEHETRAYVEHRLRVVGWKNNPLISNSVYPIIYQFSEGVPRRINLICNRLFLHSFVEQSKRITVEHARTVIEELQDEQLTPRNLLNDSMFLVQDTFDGQEQHQVVEEEEQAQPAASPDVRGQKAQFQVQEISPPTFAGDGENGEENRGIERRLEDRRSSLERREEIRFEISKEDRRKNRGRRPDDSGPAFW